MQRIIQDQLNKAAFNLKSGVVTAIPTETVYGLAVKFDRLDAIAELLRIKDREAKDDDKVLTLMVSSVEDISKYALVSPLAAKIAKKYFPGELTLVLPKSPKFRHGYFNNYSTIGIRIPNYEYTLNLLKLSGPLLVTSANLRGEVPCTDSQEVEEFLPEVGAIVEGKAGGDPPSTVVSILDDDNVKIIRQGRLKIDY